MYTKVYPNFHQTVVSAILLLKQWNVGGFKLFCHSVNGRRSGVSVVVKEEYIGSVLEVKSM